MVLFRVLATLVAFLDCYCIFPYSKILHRIWIPGSVPYAIVLVYALLLLILVLIVVCFATVSSYFGHGSFAAMWPPWVHFSLSSGSEFQFLCSFLQALRGLGCMEHRGACLADYDSGDGAGVMSQVPWAILKKQFPDLDETTTG